MVEVPIQRRIAFGMVFLTASLLALRTGVAAGRYHSSGCNIWQLHEKVLELPLEPSNELASMVGDWMARCKREMVPPERDFMQWYLQHVGCTAEEIWLAAGADQRAKGDRQSRERRAKTGQAGAIDSPQQLWQIWRESLDARIEKCVGKVEPTDASFVLLRQAIGANDFFKDTAIADQARQGALTRAMAVKGATNLSQISDFFGLSGGNCAVAANTAACEAGARKRSLGAEGLLCTEDTFGKAELEAKKRTAEQPVDWPSVRAGKIDGEEHLHVAYRQALAETKASCKGRLLPNMETWVVNALASEHGCDQRCTNLKPEDPKVRDCVSILERGIDIEGWKDISTELGKCGGDCTKVRIRPFHCIAEAREYYFNHHPTPASEFEKEQPVPCDPPVFRRLLQKLDQAMFQEQALRLVEVYRVSCKDAAAAGQPGRLANDQALLHFHQDDDASCLRSLASAPTEVQVEDATAFNRALCGGPCTLDPAKCDEAATARKNALQERQARAPLRAKANEICQAPPVYPVNLALAWDLQSAEVIERSKRPPSRTPVFWAGDVNADGIGDLVLLNAGEVMSTFETQQDLGVLLGCGTSGKYLPATFNREEVIQLTGDSEIFPVQPWHRVKVLARKDSRMKSVCLYRGKGLRCGEFRCNRAPDVCVDLREWENPSPVSKP